MGIVSREEVRNILDCVSPTLAGSIVSIALANIRTSREQVKALNMGMRNA